MATSRTVTEIIQAALRVLGVLAAGETVDTDDTGTGLTVLQDLISSWSHDFVVPFLDYDDVTLASSQASYTIGESGSPDKNTVRPIEIEEAFIRDSSDYDHPVKVVRAERYNLIYNKTSSGRPELLYYKAESPNGTIYVWPVPTTAETLRVFGRKPLTDPAQLTDDVFATTAIPREFHRAMKWNLALELADEYGVTPSQNMLMNAGRTYNQIVTRSLARAVGPVPIEVTKAINHSRYSVLYD